MPWCLHTQHNISLGLPLSLLSISNICVTSTPAIAGKVPYFVTLMAPLGARAIVVKMALGDILPLKGLLLVTMFAVPINVVRKSTDVLVNLLGFVGNKLGTYLGCLCSPMLLSQELTTQPACRSSPRYVSNDRSSLLTLCLSLRASLEVLLTQPAASKSKSDVPDDVSE
ncbi:hypothetical protein Tco_0812753 [Tanacetum coccineum]